MRCSRFGNTIRGACSRRGSSAVFLSVIMSALVAVCFAFIYSTLEYTAASRADALMDLSGDSLLAEYDRDVYEGYHLFLLRSDDRELSRKLRGYLGYTFNQEPSVSLTDVRASGAAFTLADPAPIRQQIQDFMQSGGALLMRQAAGSEDGASSGAPVISDTDAGRALRHGPTIASLPSRQLPEQDFLTRIQAAGERLSDLDSAFTDGTQRYLLASYVLGMFNSTTRTADGDHFFYREVEYILSGKLTDRENRKKTASEIRALRLAPNIAFLYSDPEKSEALAAAAQILVPGAGAVAAQAALASAWAYAESVNDANLLMKGYRVPLTKDEESWAISLENIDSRDTGSRVVHPRRDKGLTYEQYLRILLFLQDEDMTCARILDLIQINMRKNVDGRFLIGECCSGVAAQAEVNGRSHRCEKLYQALPYR